jgi:hypothetical protein
MDHLRQILRLIGDFAAQHRGIAKTDLAAYAERELGFRREGKVYTDGRLALRFSQAKGAAFANTVLALKVLREYDHLPFVVCIVRPDGVQFLLANTTLLRKISHSSQALREDNLVGSFLGHDVMREYEGLTNAPSNFDALFAAHRRIPWAENLRRLVAATAGISPTKHRFIPGDAELQAILRAPELTSEVIRSPEYAGIAAELTRRLLVRHDEILTAARIDNGNLRGNLIEELVTRSPSTHGIGDTEFRLAGGRRLLVDVKTKLLDRQSSPKAYNADKLLRELGRGDCTLAFFLIAISLERGDVVSRLVSFLDPTLIDATVIQPHWSGRDSRGATQLSGDLSRLLAPDYVETVDAGKAHRFLMRLLGPAGG